MPATIHFVRLLGLLSVTVLMAACSFFDAVKTEDFEPEDVVGTWFHVTTDSGQFSWQLVEIQAGGRKCGIAVNWDQERGFSRFFHESAWRLDDDQLVMEIRASDSYWTRVGEQVVDRLVSAGPQHFEQVLASGQGAAPKERYQRLAPEQYASVCRFTRENARLPGRFGPGSVTDPSRAGYALPVDPATLPAPGDLEPGPVMDAGDDAPAQAAPQ